MSLSRQKVDVDPLSFFASNPLDSFEEEDEHEIQQEPIKPVKTETTQKEVQPIDSVETKPQRLVENVFVKAETTATSSTKPFNQEKVESTRQPIASVEELFSSEYNALKQDPEEEFFKPYNSAANVKSSISTTTAVAKTISQIDFKKDDEDDLSDLTVAKILEREEALDEELFGRRKVAKQTIQPSKVHADLDKEANFLKELDELTTATSETLQTKTKPSTMTMSSDLFADDVSLFKPSSNTLDIDLNTLDISSYINQESNISDGGLFD